LESQASIPPARLTIEPNGSRIGFSAVQSWPIAD
jgi:hypothetical protein